MQVITVDKTTEPLGFWLAQPQTAPNGAILPALTATLFQGGTGTIDPTKQIDWGGTGAEERASVDARWGKGASAGGTGTGEGFFDPTELYQRLGWGWPSNTAKEDVRMVRGASEKIMTFLGHVPVKSPLDGGATATPPAPPAPPVVTLPVPTPPASPSVGARALFAQVWPPVLQHIRAAHGSAGPNVREAIRAGFGPLMDAAYAAGLIDDQGNLVGGQD